MAAPGAGDAVSNKPKRLNIGVVGIGRMGQRHALNILHLVPRANLLCVCSPAKPDLEWADQHLKPYGVQIYETFEQMIETPGLEAVVISSATALHASQTLVCLERGIHVLCEKPITTDLDEVRTQSVIFGSYSAVEVIQGPISSPRSWIYNKISLPPLSMGYSSVENANFTLNSLPLSSRRRNPAPRPS